MTSNTQAECPTCQGFGELPRLNGMIDGEGMMERCPTCHGTRQTRPVPQEAEKIGGREILCPIKRPAPTTEVRESEGLKLTPDGSIDFSNWHNIYLKLEMVPQDALFRVLDEEALSNTDGPQVSEPTLPASPQEPAGELEDLIKALPVPDERFAKYEIRAELADLVTLLAAEYQRGKADGAREKLNEVLKVMSRYTWGHHDPAQVVKDALAALDQGGE